MSEFSTTPAALQDQELQSLATEWRMRAMQGEQLVREAEQTVIELEADTSARLTQRERETLIRLLQKIYH